MFEADVRENSLPGTSILQLRASDADGISNSLVEYYITGDVSIMDRFRIEPNTGIITVQVGPDIN